MGYRSQVGFCIEFTKDPEEFIALMRVDGRDIFKDFLRFMYVQDYETKVEDGAYGCAHFYHDHWKWYEDSVTGLHELINMAEDFDENYKAKFVRIGEETDDNEEEWFNDPNYELEYPYMVRNVETGFALDKLKRVEE